MEHERIADLERQLSETHAAQIERNRQIAELTDQLVQKSTLLEQAEANAAQAKKRAGLEQRDLQAKLDKMLLSRDTEQRDQRARFDELLLSRDQALDEARSSLQKATLATEANERSQRELTEMRAELEVRKSESAAFRSRLPDMENDCAKGKAEADTYRNQTPTGFYDTDEDRVVHRLMERIRAEMASRRWNEKSIEEMECRNEG